MAFRPIFLPIAHYPFVKEQLFEFEWHAGFAKVQSQKCIRSLHESAANSGIQKILEISSKSFAQIGISLSAFNLKFQQGDHYLSVECAYQGSKVFNAGGPFSELYAMSSREAKKDERLRSSGEFIGYNFFGNDFPSKPTTGFYNWLYLNALAQNPELSERLFDFDGFSDIAFNPKKSFNCQARAAALYVSLHRLGVVNKVLQDKSYYLNVITKSDALTNQAFEGDQPFQLELSLKL